MAAVENKINTILVGQDIEKRIVFKNALKALKIEPFQYFFEVEKGMFYLDAYGVIKPDFIFIEAGKKEDTLEAISKIRSSQQFDMTSIVLHNTGYNETDTKDVFSAGANVAIRKNYDFNGLKTVLNHIIRFDSQYHSGTNNHETYMLSI